MPIKEIFVETTYYAGGEATKVPVYYTDELRESSIYDLAWSSVHSSYLPYLFVGYLRNKKGWESWYFANARMHEEMEVAIKQGVEGEVEYTYGQIFLTSFNPEIDLQIRQLVLNNNISKDKNIRETALRHLIEVIRPEYLTEDLRIGLSGREGEEWDYVYRKNGNGLQKI